MSSKVQLTIDAILAAITASTAAASTLDSIEQWGRIILLFISIVSGTLIIIVNWDKAISRLKRKSNGTTDI